MFDSIDLNSKQNVRAIGLPIFIFVVLLILTIVAGNTAYKEYQKQAKVLESDMVQETALKLKLDTLSSVEIVSLDATNRSLVALPEKNPGLFMVSQLKSLAQKHTLEVLESTVDKDSNFNDTISKAKISMVLGGTELSSFIDFLKETTTLSPLSTIDDVSISVSRNEYEMEMAIFVYWSALPHTLPALTEPIKNLSTNDEEILRYLSNLTIPSFTVLNPTDPIERENPFR